MITIDSVEMVDVREAAELMHRTPETIRRWAPSHRVRAVKHGNRLLLRRGDLLRLDQARDRSAARLLAEWAELVRTTQTAGSEGSSSRDLILGDRAGRRQPGAIRATGRAR
jgi:excisionase family DNA binding protein